MQCSLHTNFAQFIFRGLFRTFVPCLANVNFIVVWTEHPYRNLNFRISILSFMLEFENFLNDGLCHISFTVFLIKIYYF